MADVAQAELAPEPPPPQADLSVSHGQLQPRKPDFALTVTHPQVQQLAKAFRWRPQTAIARIERALPAKFEQQIYLVVGSQFRILPESLAKLLHLYRARKYFQLQDLEQRPVGKNLVSNPFGQFTDYFAGCMNLWRLVAGEFSVSFLSLELVGRLVLAYGTEEPERIIELLDTNLDECCRILGISTHRSYPERMRLCLWLFVTEILTCCRARGIPDPVNLDDFMAPFRYVRAEIDADSGRKEEAAISSHYEMEIPTSEGRCPAAYFRTSDEPDIEEDDEDVEVTLTDEETITEVEQAA